MPSNVIVIDHPLVLHKLTHLRQKERSTNSFRSLLAEISILLAYEVTRDLPLVYETVETPFATMRAPVIDGKKIVIINILRAGTGMTEGMLQILPSARVGHIGVYRDEQEHVPVDYYERLPPGLPYARVYVLDPMLATGGSAVHALHHLKRAGAAQLELVCLVAAPAGVQAVQDEHPEVPIWTAAVDRELDENAYIRPGLGDAGDRVFGTV
jgi:uracil phosphoribosyltransferase